MLRFFTYLIVIALFVSGCTTPVKLVSTNMADMYSWESKSFMPEFTVFHNKDTSSELYFKIQPIELMYLKGGKGKGEQCQVKVKYILYDSYETEVVVDSLTSYLIKEKPENLRAYITGKFAIKAEKGKNYLLRITTTDVYQNRTYETLININKKSPLTRQNFLLTDAAGNVVFNDFFDKKQDLIIHYNDESVETLHARWYNGTFKLPPPPFSMHTPPLFNYENTDSTYNIMLFDGTGKVTVPDSGFLHLVAKIENKDGLTLFKYPSNYPKLNTLNRMVEPLRYITSKKEFNALLEKGNKEALDEFWISNAPNNERARDLIAHYYSRVEFANNTFSSFNEGWKTDRGMAYLIFGPPNLIYKNSRTESWIYGEDKNYMSVNFIFTKVANPFTDNDYRLSRSSIYKSHWYRAVDSWRQGRVFLNN